MNQEIIRGKSSTILYREDLETDEDIADMIITDEQEKILYATMFYSSAVLLMILLA